MTLFKIKSPREALNKVYLTKVPLARVQMDTFKENLKLLLDKIDDLESEEHAKTNVRDFLRETYYKNNNEINVSGRKDLVIHNDKTGKSDIGVIIEAKRPSNKAEFPSKDDLNVKAMHELIYYYLNERIDAQNQNLKQLIITNGYEWFIFDAQEFSRLFYQKSLINQYEKFRNNEMVEGNTSYFYNEIAKPYFAKIYEEAHFTYFDIREYREILYNDDAKDDKKLIALYKILSPEHLLKKPFVNDSNTLDTKFYNELLHILGLEEVTDKGKKLITRKKKPDYGSFVENTMNMLISGGKLENIDDIEEYGENEQEQLFAIALELVITWINRILFLKLMEAQLVKYHKGDKEYKFMSSEKINDLDNLNRLFFEVLAKTLDERSEYIRAKYEKIPYLNSSLFEVTDTERLTICLNSLDDNVELPILSSTVLKDRYTDQIKGNMNTLEYLLRFLDAYDFSSEGSEDIQEENKSLINASVLGLIFEKINGYKDGSFFTPGFITMYMTRETIRRAVVQKFNEHYNWQIEDFKELRNKIEDKQEANEIVNSIKICDPAVGSGHFLVSALNEMIAIKSELGILCDEDGKRLRDYSVSVVNDELNIVDEDYHEAFEYYPGNKERQRIQETVFNEKRTIIENCLFGVDINQNSVNICRLRLWIELLKNAYYTKASNYEHLETLPNIDINIKTGNSLISRFDIHDSESSFAAGYRNTVRKATSDFKLYVSEYKETTSKKTRRDLRKKINGIKEQFSTLSNPNDPEARKIKMLEAELREIPMFSSEDDIKRKQKLEMELIELKSSYNEKLKTLYGNAFEWRFEFPEVLDDDGNFEGFDIVIGNPPYIQLQKNYGYLGNMLSDRGYDTFVRTGDIYMIFYEKGIDILKPNAHESLITSNKWMRAGYGAALRTYFATKTQPIELVDLGANIFDSATVDTNIMLLKNAAPQKPFIATTIKYEKYMDIQKQVNENHVMMELPEGDESWVILSELERSIKKKIEEKGTPLKDWDIEIYRGVLTGYNDAFIINGKKKDELIAKDPKSAEIIKPLLRGRDIKRYRAEFADKWLIATFPALKLEIDDYPAVRDYLKTFGKRIHQIGGAGHRKKTCNKWFETQDPNAYYKEFDKEIIVWKAVGKNLTFSLWGNGRFLTNPACFLRAENNKFVLSFLHTKLIKYQVIRFSDSTGAGDVMLNVQSVLLLHVPQLSQESQAPFISLVEQILTAKERDPGADTSELENKIDIMVYKLYDLTYDEVLVVDPNFPNIMSREEYEVQNHDLDRENV